MVSTLDRIRTTRILTQGPPGSGLSLAEKADILDDIAQLEADMGDLLLYQTESAGYISTLQADMLDTRQGWLSFVMDGGGVALTTGVKFRAIFPFDCTITADPVDGHIWRVGLDQSGSIGLDLWTGTHAAYPPTSAGRFSGTVGSNNPRVTTATNAASGSTTNWSLSITGGRWFFINIASITTAQAATLGLYVVRS